MQIQIGLEKVPNYQLALSLVKRGQHMEALDRFIQILEDHPKSLAAMMIPLYRYLKHHENDHQLRIMLAQLYMVANRYKEAIFELETLFEEEPSFTQTYFLLSKIYKKDIGKKTIFSIFEKAFEQGIYDSAIIDLLPKVYLETNNIEQSIHFFDTLIKKVPENIHYYKTLASLYKKTRQYDRAVDILKQMVEKSPDLASDAAKECEQMSRTDPMNKKIRELLIQFYLQSCQPDPAVKHIEDLVLMDPSYISEAIRHFRSAQDTYPNTASIQLALSKVLIQINEYTEAISHLQQLQSITNDYNHDIIPIIESILKQIPNQVLALELLISIYTHQKDVKNSIETLKKLCEIDTPPIDFIENITHTLKQNHPENLNEITLILAKTYAAAGNATRCTLMCQELIETPYHYEARLLETRLLEKKGKYKQCLEELHLLLRQFPEEPTIHEHLKRILKTKNKLDIAYYESKNSTDYYEIGQRHLENGTVYEALENFQKISPKDHGYENCQILIARCFLELGRFDMTINQLSRTLQYLANSNAELANKLRFIMSINHLYLGKTKDAIQELENILEYDINFPKVEPLLKELKTQSLLDLRGKAIAGCSINSDTPPTLLTIPNQEEHTYAQQQKISFAHPHNNQGVDYLLKQNPTSAEAEFNLAIQMDSSLTVAHCNLAILQLQKKNFETALNHLKEAETLNKNFDLIYLNRGLVYYTQKKYDLAIENYQKALKINPKNHLAGLNLGDTYFHKNRLKLAFQYWEKAATSGTLLHFIQRRIFYLYETSPKDLDWIEIYTPSLSTLLPGL